MTGLDVGARGLKEKFLISYTVALSLVRKLGLEGATAHLEARAATFHLSPELRAGCTGDSHRAALTARGQPFQPSTVRHGTCALCGDVVDEEAAVDYMRGPRMRVELPARSGEVVHRFMKLPMMQLLTNDRNDAPDDVVGRRQELERLQAEFLNIGRTSHELAEVSRHAAHRIEAALRGARS